MVASDISLIYIKPHDNPSYNEAYFIYLHIIIKIKAMTKDTMANKLPRKLIQKMAIVGGTNKACQITPQPKHGTSCRKSNLL